MLSEALRRSQAVATPGDRVRAAINLAELLDFAGRPAEALDVVRAEAEAAVGRPERSSYDAFLRLQEVNLLSRMGRLEEARERLPRRVPGEAISYTQQFWRAMRARIALLSGDLEGLRGELEATERLVDANREPQWLEPYALNRAELAAARGPGRRRARRRSSRAAQLLQRSDEANRLMRVAAMAERVEAEAAGPRARAGRGLRARARRAGRGDRRARLRPPALRRGVRVGRDGARRSASAAASCSARRRPNPAKWLEVASAFDAITYPVPADLRALPRGGGLRRGRATTPPPPSRCAPPARRRAETGAKLLSADIASLARRARIDVESVDPVDEPAGRGVAGRAPRPDPARARGAPARRGGPDEPRDRRGAVHEREDRVGPRLADPRQARRGRPRRGRRRRAPARAHQPRARLKRKAAERTNVRLRGQAPLRSTPRGGWKPTPAHLLPDPARPRRRAARAAAPPLRRPTRRWRCSSSAAGTDAPRYPRPRGAAPPPRARGPARPRLDRSPAASRARRTALRFEQRMQPLGGPTRRTATDALVAAIRAGDPDAASELWWRVNERVRMRLRARLGDVEGPRAERNVLGRILDEVAALRSTIPTGRSRPGSTRSSTASPPSASRPDGRLAGEQLPAHDHRDGIGSADAPAGADSRARPGATA